ncbi:hypothetical protein GWA97_07630 [Flavobacterium sp. LaA7.5]|nr:hypothetical protein [Flavobacterium salilacus subsp. altitudinum]
MDEINQQLPFKMTGITSVPIWTALISFTGGTLLFLLQFAVTSAEKDNIWMIGFFYVITAFVINIVVFAIMIVMSFIRKEQQKEILINTSVQLINIPVALAYMYILFT